jgi:succinate dehydrogenase / fumarate reductase cytochrome b subunit
MIAGPAVFGGSMSWFSSFYRSALGKKAVMALTGLVFWGFVLGHMAGNLKLFLGAEAINHYAEWLREMGQPLLPRGGLLWIVRAVLVASLALHVHAALALTLINRRARPQDYSRHDMQQASLAARTMRWSGVALLLFVVYHLMHFTVGNVHPDFVPGDVHHNLAVAFSSGLIAAIYIVAMVLLGMHLVHGLWSLFQSLGWNHPRYNPWRRVFAVVFALVIALGFIAVPASIALGLLGSTR